MPEHTVTLQEIIDDIHAMTKACEIYERKCASVSPWKPALV